MKQRFQQTVRSALTVVAVIGLTARGTLAAETQTVAWTTYAKIRRLTYEQNVTLTREIGTLDWVMIQGKTTGFFTDFEAYIRQQEVLRAQQEASQRAKSTP